MYVGIRMSGRADRRRQSTGETTQPATSTRREQREAREIAIHWQFPRPQLTLLTADEKLLGRSDHCATILPGNETSREHAGVWRDGPLAMIRDRQSVNGVFVNGSRRELAPLAEGDVVRVGEGVGLVVHVQSGDVALGVEAIAPGWYGGPRLREAIDPLRTAAKSTLPIVIEGETGTGKEGLCESIHRWSERPGKLVAVNCAALPESLAEAELFGYRRGAFTGASQASVGYIRAAHGGTLLLDEVVELPLALQAKLLRVLEQRAVCPLGEASSVPVDFRVVTAAQEPLARKVEAKLFRADLWARLNGMTVELPPLRERREDIVPLFVEFLAAASAGPAPGLEPRLIERLVLYDWPLNVRELVLLANQLVSTHPGRALRRSHLPERILRAKAAGAPPTGTSKRSSTDDDVSFEQLVMALRTHKGNVSRAAEALGITRGRAYRLFGARSEFDVSRLRQESEPERDQP